MKTARTYSIGFVFSLAITLTAFGLVWEHLQTGHVFPSHELLYPLLIALAVVQLVVQAICFLHIGQESKPRYNLLAFLFAILVVAIIVGGSLWIMSNVQHQHDLPNTPYIGNVITPTNSND